MLITYLLLLSLLLLTFNPTNAASKDEVSFGTPHDSVQTLTASNFRSAIQDSANGLWLLKFYAPWCGHCKKMAPMLDTVAPLLQNKLAIGKINCDQETQLCKEFNIKGFPTLKYARDGDVQDFPFGRSQEDIVTFANRMHAPAVKQCDAYEDAVQLATNADNGIVFCVVHPDLDEQEENVHARLMSTRFTQVFAQSARIQQAHGSFCTLSPSSKVDDLSVFGLSEIPKDGFMAKIEAGGVPPKLFMGSADVSTPQVLDFIQQHNVPLVATLGPHNFHSIGKKGKPLVIGAVDGSSTIQVQEMKQSLLQYCIEGPPNLVDQYYFGWLNGKQWNKFLLQFNITADDLPQVFVLNVPTKTYWHDDSFESIGDFLNAIENGTVQPKEAASAQKGRLDQFVDLFFDFYPWSVAVLVATLVLLVLLLLPAPQELRPPYPREEEEPTSKDLVASPQAQAAQQSTDTTGTTRTGKKDDDTPVETKKEK